jgi:hypothetical protein
MRLDDNKCRYENEKCQNPNYQICGPCWYAGVIIQPVENIPECKDCLKDMETFKQLLKDNSNKNDIEMEPKCCIWCIWFEWFDKKRLNQCGNRKLIYKRPNNKKN